MAIEVRQLNIRSVVSGNGDAEGSPPSPAEAERLKRELLSECRQMVLDLMRAERER
jgi:hypothetical protein